MYDISLLVTLCMEATSLLGKGRGRGVKVVEKIGPGVLIVRLSSSRFILAETSLDA